MNRDLLIIGMSVALLILLCALLFVRCQARTVETIQVVDRYWAYALRVTYTTTDLVCRTDSDGEQSCHLETSTHTRCRDTSYGRELPPMRPEIPCYMRRGDDLRESITYKAGYRVVESGDKKIKHLSFRRGEWDVYHIDSMFRVTLNGLGVRLKMEPLEGK